MAGYLLDTNSVIYFFNGEGKISELIDNATEDIAISFITEIEMLSFEIDDPAIKRKIADFLKEIKIVLIDEDIIKATIEFRKKFKFKVPDAIICATAKSLGLTLVTADKILIKKLKGIKIISPI